MMRPLAGCPDHAYRPAGASRIPVVASGRLTARGQHVHVAPVIASVRFALTVVGSQPPNPHSLPRNRVIQQ